MNRTKFLRKVVSLVLAVVITVSLVPGMRTRAAEAGWTLVTSDNIASMEDNMTDLKIFGEEWHRWIFFNRFLKVHETDMANTDLAGYYIIGKLYGKYECLRKADNQFVECSLSDIESGTQNYYFWPSYSLSLDLDGGTSTEGTLTPTVTGMLADTPTTPKKQNYFLTGWFDVTHGTGEIKLDAVYDETTELRAYWTERADKEWVKITSVDELKNISLPLFSTGRAVYYLEISQVDPKYILPEDADFGIVGRGWVDSQEGYLLYHPTHEDEEEGFVYEDDISLDTALEEKLENGNYYVLVDPNTLPAVTPTPEPAATETPAPATEEPATPETPAPATEEPATPETPAPATTEPDAPATATPAPVTPAPTTTEDETSASPASTPELRTTNLTGDQLSGWEAITKAIATQTGEKQQKVSGANQDLLHVDAGSFDKTIPAATVKAVSSSALRGLHVFIGNSDAVTFLAKSNLSGYKETDFAHEDTVTDHTRTIMFTHRQALGTTVVFHTTIPVKMREVTVYKVDGNNGRTRITQTVSNASGQVCFPITETATYVLEY